MHREFLSLYFCSWHEIAIRDLPTMIDYILKTTGHEKLFYLGHSQGTTSFFAMSAQMPEYQNKVHAMFAMAPVAYCGKMTSPIFQLLARLTKPIDVRNSPKLADESAIPASLLAHTCKRNNNMQLLQLATKLIGMYEFSPTSEAMKKFAALVCSEDAITQPLCSNVLFLTAGYDPDQFNKVRY